MADQVVSDAVRYPQDEGLGSITDGNETWDSAGYLGGLADALGESAFVYNGLSFSNHDATADTISVESGRAYVRASAPDVQSGLGGASPPNYDTTMSTSVFIMLVMPTSEAGIQLQDSTLSSVWLAYATDGSVSGVSAGDIYIRSDDTGSVTAPPHPSVKLGDADPDNSSNDTRANPRPVLNQVEIGDLNMTGPTTGNQNELRDFQLLELGPQSAATTRQILQAFRSERTGYIDTDGGDFRIRADNANDVRIENDANDGITISDATSDEGAAQIQGQLGALTRFREMEAGSFDADDYETAFRVHRNGNLIGYLDQSGDDLRMKCFNSAGDAEVVNSDSDGMAIRSGTANADFDGDLEIDTGQQLNNDFGEAYLEFDEEDGLADSTTYVVFNGTHEGLVVVTVNTGDSGVFLFANDTVTLISSDGPNGFTTTANNTGTHNVYHTGSDYVVENDTGSSADYDMIGIGSQY